MNNYEVRREARRNREIDAEWERQELEKLAREMERERFRSLEPIEQEAEKLGVSVDEMKCLKDLGGDDYKTLWFGSLAQ